MTESSEVAPDDSTVPNQGPAKARATTRVGLAGIATIFIGPVTLGAVVGMLAGMAWEQDVLAAVLPAVLAAAGGIVFAVPSLLHNGTAVAIHGTAASIIVALFAASLFFGSLYGKGLAEDEAKEAADELIDREVTARKARWTLQRARLRECSQDQLKLNAQRKKTGLEPLMIHQVCPELPGPGLLGRSAR